MTTKCYHPFCPIEFQSYKDWMEKNNYSQFMIKKNIQCVKRVGYLLANSKMEPREIAALTTATHGGKNGVANAINDYRYFVDAKLKRSNLIEQYINLDDGVLV